MACMATFFLYAPIFKCLVAHNAKYQFNICTVWVCQNSWNSISGVFSQSLCFNFLRLDYLFYFYLQPGREYKAPSLQQGLISCYFQAHTLTHTHTQNNKHYITKIALLVCFLWVSDHEINAKLQQQSGELRCILLFIEIFIEHNWKARLKREAPPTAPSKETIIRRSKRRGKGDREKKMEPHSYGCYTLALVYVS